MLAVYLLISIFKIYMSDSYLLTVERHSMVRAFYVESVLYMEEDMKRLLIKAGRIVLWK